MASDEAVGLDEPTLPTGPGSPSSGAAVQAIPVGCATHAVAGLLIMDRRTPDGRPR